MLGIAALGTAVGAAAKGYMEGEKHRSDMEDAEMRRELAGTQLRKAKREEEYEREVSDLYKDVQKAQEPAQTGGIATPAAPSTEQQALANDNSGAPPVSGTPVAAPAKAGITPPGGAAAPSASGLGNLASMQGIIERRQALDLKYGKINEVQALQMMKNYNQLQKEGVIEGFDYFQRTGDREGAIQRINATGAMKLDPNAQFKIEQKEIAPGFKMPNVVVTSPDGQHSFNQYDAMTGALSPKEAFSLKHDVGIKLATLSWQRESGERLYNLQKLQYEGQIAHWGTMQAEQKRQTQIALDRLGVEQSNRIMTKIDAGRKEANASVGFVPLADDKLDALSNQQKAAYSQKMMAGQAVAATWEANIDLKTGNPGVTISEAKAATQFANKNPSAVKTENGQWFVNMGDKKVFVPIPPAELERQLQGSQPASGPGPAAAGPSTAANAAPGISTPQAPPQPVQSSPAPAQDPGPKPTRQAGETFNSFRDRTVAWDNQRQAFEYQQRNAASEQERQRLVAARGGINRPQMSGASAPVQAGINTPIMPGPYGQPPVYPDPNAPSIYADPNAWSQYRQGAGR